MTPSELRERDARRIFAAGVAAVDARRLVQGRCPEVRERFRAGGFRRLLVLGCGKAAAPMALAVEEGLADLPLEGLVVTRYGYGNHGLRRIGLREGGHPVPDAAGAAATAEIVAGARAADGTTLVLFLVSGGGSALLVLPAEGIALEEKRETTRLLLASGAGIREVNAVRKHLSAVKGGQLAAAAFPAAVESLILSDVIGDPLDVIASGPTVPDTSTFVDALSVIDRRRLRDTVPPAVLRRLREGSEGRIAETPKEGDPIFARVRNSLVGSNRTALLGAQREAERLGYRTDILCSGLSGEAREAGRRLAAVAREVVPAERPLCLLSGGETTVVVTGAGQGGRNQELALAFACDIEGTDGITLLSAGTDGSDGTTDAAGAVVDGTTVERGRLAGLDPQASLASNDSWSFFRSVGGLVVTGPTGTNVMDLQVMLLG